MSGKKEQYTPFVVVVGRVEDGDGAREEEGHGGCGMVDGVFSFSAASSRGGVRVDHSPAFGGVHSPGRKEVLEASTCVVSHFSVENGVVGFVFGCGAFRGCSVHFGCVTSHFCSLCFRQRMAVFIALALPNCWRCMAASNP